VKILLINPLVREWAKPNCFPSGLGYIAAVLQEQGHIVEVLDLNVCRTMGSDDKRLSEVLDSKDYDLLGITGIITQYGEVKRIASLSQKIKEHALIICGGPLASSVPELLLKKTEVDLVVLGEGEKVIIRCCNERLSPFLEDLPPGLGGKSFSGEIFINRSSKVLVDIDNLPWPAYSLFPMDEYLTNPIGAYNTNKWIDGAGSSPLSLNIVGSRGCLFDCIFCYHNYMGEGYRLRSPASIVREMCYLQDKYGVSYIHFTDDAFASHRGYIREFCKIKKNFDKLRMARGISRIEWSCAGRADVVNEQMVWEMKDAGCIGLCFGLESGSQRILDFMHKRISLEQYKKAIDLNKRFFSYEDYTFIVGTPGESEQTVWESIKFCKQMDIVPTAVFYMTPYPGTQLFKWLKENDSQFLSLVSDMDRFERWILDLGEQGERIAWNCTNQPDEVVEEWHRIFIEETGAWNKRKH
jgi:radical SAM superfamily enzyme YgiQ (UPF0313 family)